ncbi:MAG: hypothetical protein OXU43_02130 [Gammaproteobacteria bacterium]|nr:hypothetical protein [Gammaproteobacteria bacterium]
MATSRPRVPSSRTYTVFLGLQFRSKKYDRSDIVSAVERAAEMAQDDLQRTHPGVSIKVRHQANPGEPINSQIISLVKNAAAAIFEVSEENSNVYFEMGLAYASLVTKPLLLFKKQESQKVRIASDVQDILRLEYLDGGSDQMVGRIAQHIKKLIRGQIKQEQRQDAWADLRKIWSGSSRSQQTTIICPELPPSYQPKYAKPDSPEFVNLARFGDLDALVEVLTLLPQLAPNMETKYVTAQELQQRDRQGNVIVIGGPDFNSFAKDLLDRQSFPFTYRNQKKKIALYERTTKKGFQLQKNRKYVTHDYGLFARFPNPLNRQNVVIMIGGLQTFGVLGSVHAFGMNSIGKKNVKRVMKHCSGTLQFAVLVPVNVSGGQSSKSDIDMSTFHLHPW